MKKYNQQRRSFLKSLTSSLSTEIISQPEILQAIKESFIPSEVDKILSNYITVPQVQDYFLEKINSFSDIPESFRTSSFNIFEKENPILRKVTENGFNVWSFLDFSSQPLHHIYSAIKWYPELLNKISDEDFIVIINELRDRSNLAKEYFEMLYRYKPNVIWHFFEEKPYIFTY